MTGTARQRRGRIAALDIARTVALIGMAIYHFTYDLEMFGYLTPGTAVTGFWAIFARLVAGSFLFLAGISLWLAHAQGIRWRPFVRRFAMIAGAALMVTLGTRIALPQTYVFFGILHSIAAASLVGLLFLRLPAAITIAVAACVFAISRLPHGPAFDVPLLWPLGLSTNAPPAIDYVPLFPWLAPFLAGLALAKLGTRTGLWSRLTHHSEPGLLAWPGRHSLAIYLIHQPVLIGLVWAATQIMR
ncbi:heparan-alpha-glucosaminide N-acetyltransferase [Defluviimonas aestuarii]|uniref:heparan-alpha-glucosaminide N-acetyltransferase n=1 Tax=Albidovulum aestuarii TaxID=1130726 RepID=UPI00249AC5DB|nr:heparan-alpha-glucosaminide N-acetyltransferase [Defluviimonas aestuarii]MDI3336141.1 heparan-alpha-glucosaminide N-acetyltransferase [Defluviimonas aestuarii]